MSVFLVLAIYFFLMIKQLNYNKTQLTYYLFNITNYITTINNFCCYFILKYEIQAFVFWRASKNEWFVQRSSHIPQLCTLLLLSARTKVFLKISRFFEKEVIRKILDLNSIRKGKYCKRRKSLKVQNISSLASALYIMTLYFIN